MFKNFDSVLDCSVKVKGNTIYIKVKFTASTTLSRAKLRCNTNVDEKYSDYDIQYEIFGKDFHVNGFWIDEYNYVAWDDVYDYE